ncbi:MAG: VCBS repeat-containing protein [Planctomycetes bacterium]|nr:VCBS repeat-containing protein [Planctomycetota bacterium]
MIRILLIALSSGSLGVGIAAAQGDPPLLGYGTYAEAPVECVAAGDLDHDGDTDLVTTAPGAVQAFVWLADGVGGLALGQVHPFVSGTPTAIELADLDLDGNLDVLVTCAGPNTVVVCRGKGNGKFFPKVSYASGIYPVDLEVGQFDGDPYPDVITVDFASGTVSMMLGDGSGGLLPAIGYPTQVPPPTQLRPWDAVLGDFDADGKLDVSVTNLGTDSVALLRGDGTGVLATPTLTTTAQQPLYSSSADVDADGDLDLVVAFSGTNGIRTLVNDGSGGFVQSGFFALPWQPRSLTLGDVDGDGDPDALTCSGWSGPAQLFLGDGVGGFGGPTTLATGDAPISTAVNDLTGDGIADIVIGFNYTAELSILRGLGAGRFVRPIGQNLGFGVPRFALDDFDGDHRIDVATLVSGQPNRLAIRFGIDGGMFGSGTDYPIAAYAGDLAVGDVDADGFLDLSLLFRTTGACWLQVYRGAGAGAFIAGPSTTVPADALKIVAADLNHDGRSDAVIQMNNSATLAVSLADGAGGYALPVIQLLPWQAKALRVDDFDGDGVLDGFAIASNTPDYAFLRGDGLGGFASPSSAPCGETLSVIEVGDFVEDHRPDVFGVSATKYHLFTNIGGGEFAQSSWSTVHPVRVTVADMNRDLHLDVISSGMNRTSVSLGDGQGQFYETQWFRSEGADNDVEAIDLNGDSLPDVVAASLGSDGLFVSINDLGCSIKSYCAAKLNSQGCVPAIDSTGTPSATSPSGFVVRCLNSIDGQAGTLLYSLLGPTAQPFQGGTLCVQAPFSRTPIVQSGGSGPCSGVLSLDFNQFASGAHGGHPKPALRIPGTIVFAQWWGRDSGFAPPNDTQLSNALVFHMCP